MPPDKSKDPAGKQKVLIIGAGAAGMSCAAMLAKEPDKFDVTVFERNNQAGGKASALAINGEKFGADWVNRGAQGGVGLYRHTYKFFRDYGYEPKERRLQFAFGKGKESFWTNVFPTHLQQKYVSEITRFEKLLRKVQYVPFLWYLPLRHFLRLFGFSPDFGFKMLYPLVAFFCGSGTQAPNVPCGLFRILFEDPVIAFWHFDKESLLPPIVTAYAFPNMTRFYMDWTAGLRAQGVKIRFNTQVLKFIQRDKAGIVAETRWHDADQRITDEGIQDRNITELFDKVVFCIPGNQAKELLGTKATRMEKLVLGATKWHNNLNVIHNDSNYFQRKYEAYFREENCPTVNNKRDENRMKYARGEFGRPGFRPTFCTYSYKKNTDNVDVAYDCSRFQYQFQSGDDTPPIEQHVFSSHFPGKTAHELWTTDAIDQSLIIEKEWWHKLSYTWRHFAQVVPGMKFVNGKNNTLYAGAWTFIDMHEGAVISGMNAAYRLGARYDKIDDLADNLFTYFLKMSHGKKFKRKVANTRSKRER
ncbi:hypothetical protein FQN57_006394 [Myotisia sp. PD_48]|nr:hypothetical protein FQN57_006394 [Myotisia sp. PD_48]